MTINTQKLRESTVIGNQQAEDLRRCCDMYAAENKRLREALTAFVDYAENHGEITFAGGGMKAVDALNEATRKAQAALAQEQGGSVD